MTIECQVCGHNADGAFDLARHYFDNRCPGVRTPKPATPGESGICQRCGPSKLVRRMVRNNAVGVLETQEVCAKCAFIVFAQHDPLPGAE